MTVKSYLNYKNLSTLHFFLDQADYEEYFENQFPESVIEENNAEKLKLLSLPELIVKILYLSKYFKSENKAGKIETSFNKNRSSLDIWRHVKYYLPEITIYDIMNELYKLNSFHFYTLLCPDIKRRVFHWSGEERGVIYNESFRDEFGLTFYEWENIKEE